MTSANPLTRQQERVLRAIHEHVALRGYQPSIREIADALGLRSAGSVHFHLRNLEAQGYLTRSAPRGLELQRDVETHLQQQLLPVRAVPLVGDVSAGLPIVAEERVEAVYSLPVDLVGDGPHFMLSVRGESMVDAGVLPGDYVVVRQQPMVESGEMCVALLEGDATVKYFRRTGQGSWALEAANDAFAPITLDDSSPMSIIGKVVAIIRTLP
ncbi:transcriptional repressor LexA [Egicoccus sp. AB-alg2]|uniref:transcriptional repressor LexA n=1 Tax=Egicoccus sp. AB-alg2 TaxID=3242693 RepID=UPI00359D9F54